MSLVGFKARNHPQQAVRDDVDDRRTLPELFDPLHARHRFTVDVAASKDNAILPRYFARPGTPPRCMWAADGECGSRGCERCPHGGSGPAGIDGLAQSWRGERVWCNPPFSRPDLWVRKAWSEMRRGCELVVMLLPANRCEQKWWQEMVESVRDREPRDGIRLTTRFLAGRTRFGWPDDKVFDKRGDRPPFGCVLLTWERAA